MMIKPQFFLFKKNYLICWLIYQKIAIIKGEIILNDKYIKSIYWTVFW